MSSIGTWDPARRQRRGYYTDEQIEADYGHEWPAVADDDPAGYAHENLANCKNRFIWQNVAVAFGEGFGKVASLADMSAGDGRVPRSLAEYSGIEPLLGDYTPGLYPYSGTYQQTVPMLPVVELFVSTNTVEHLNDPDGDLALIRTRCEKMLLVCPIDEEDAGGQHLWYWTRGGVEDMFTAAGFQQEAYCELDENPVWEHFKFGMWALR